MVFSVFRGLKYDDIKPNHAKKTPKNAKTKKMQIALQCTTMHSSEAPQLLTTDGSNMTHNDAG